MAIAIAVNNPAALSSYADLVARLPDYLDNRVGQDQYPAFISLCEREIDRRLAVKPVLPMYVRRPITVASEFQAAPDNILRPVSLELTDGNTVWPVDYVPPETVAQLEPSKRFFQAIYTDLFVYPGNAPKNYTILNGEFRFFPAPQQSYTGEMYYYEKLPALTDDSQSNWFFADHPDVYLFGALAHANAFLPDQEKAEYFGNLFDQALTRALGSYPTPPSMAQLRVEPVLSISRRGRFWGTW